MAQPTVVTDVLRLWDYTISHKAALFRRPCSDTEPENLDLVFVAVEYFSLPTSLQGLEIAEGSAPELAALCLRIGSMPAGARLFVITSQGKQHLIIAGGWQLERNRRAMFESGIRPSAPVVQSTVLASSAS